VTTRSPVSSTRSIGRFVVELVARYVVVSYLRRVSTEMRNLYWLRAIQSPVGTPGGSCSVARGSRRRG
jgi:hypothetical protein